MSIVECSKCGNNVEYDDDLDTASSSSRDGEHLEIYFDVECENVPDIITDEDGNEKRNYDGNECGQQITIVHYAKVHTEHVDQEE